MEPGGHLPPPPRNGRPGADSQLGETAGPSGSSGCVYQSGERGWCTFQKPVPAPWKLVPQAGWGSPSGGAGSAASDRDRSHPQPQPTEVASAVLSSSPGQGEGYRGPAGNGYLCGTPGMPQAGVGAAPAPGLAPAGVSPGSGYPLGSSCSDGLPGPGLSSPPGGRSPPQVHPLPLTPLPEHLQTQ